MKGRKVIARGQAGEVQEWAPLSSGMCDTLISFADGSSCWFSSTELRPNDGLGPLPSRADVRARTEAETKRQLREIRAQHVRDFHKPWPGCEHGKAILGLAIDAALDDEHK